MPPPADRPAGRRGARGPIACVVAILGLVPFAFSQGPSELDWSELAYGAAGVAAVAAAVLIWVARQPSLLVAGVALAVLACGGFAVTQAERARANHERDRWAGASWRYDAKSRPVTKRQVDDLPEHASRATVIAVLGRTRGRGIQWMNGEPNMRCLVYNGTRVRDGRPRHGYGTCFRDGRLEAVRRW